MFKRSAPALISVCLGASQGQAKSQKPPLEIWLDADFANHFESSFAIEIGAKAALKEKKLSRDIIIVRKDHKGSSKRSKKNIEKFLESQNGLTMMSGIHSPPLLAHKKYINKNKVPFLVPWAAAGPITRSENKENYIFRLSIDDTKAGGYLSDYAVKSLKSKAPCLLLEQTGWGRSNHKNMTKGFKSHNIQISLVKWFNWGLQIHEAKSIAASIYQSSCDLILLVANSREGSILVQVIAEHPTKKKIPILSHWGITGGVFHEKIPHSVRSAIDLKFIQTRFNFTQVESNPLGKKLLKDLIQDYETIQSSQDINAGTGTSHAYDLTRIMLVALQIIDLDQDIKTLRTSFKKALENIEEPIEGLIKTYRRPFKEYSKNNPEAHEALGKADFAIGQYDARGTVVNLTD